jgi:hypothetical protein
MSEACVTDSFARAKEAWSGSIRSPYPDGGRKQRVVSTRCKSATRPRPLSIPDARPEDLARYDYGLRKAGLPEQRGLPLKAEGSLQRREPAPLQTV